MLVKLNDTNSSYFNVTDGVTYKGNASFEVPYAEGRKGIANGILKEVVVVKKKGADVQDTPTPAPVAPEKPTTGKKASQPAATPAADTAPTTPPDQAQ